MITMNELLSGNKLEDLSDDLKANGEKLLEIMNKFRSAYGKSMIVTSGFRSMPQHLEIYRKKGITDKSKIPMKSSHLEFKAVDISDPNGELKEYIKNNLKLVEDLNLYFEDFSTTTNWVHFTYRAPASGKRFFMP